jgi:predicted oxidoreductase
MDCDLLVIGAGLAGLVAATEAAARGLKVIVLDQEGEQGLGGQAFWSLGGLFFVDSPEQRRLRIRDNIALARQDWFGSAGFDRPEDHWPRLWAEAYLDFASGEKRAWLHAMGMRWFPVVGWAERGGGLATGHGNSVPRFHVTWGTGPGVLAPFIRRAQDFRASNALAFRFRHRVDGLIVENGVVLGAHGAVLAPDAAERGRSTSREVVGDFSFRAGAVLVSSGGIGGNHELVRQSWPRDRLGEPPAFMVSGVPAHVDGRMLAITQAAGGSVINGDRMWHYTEGVRNWDPIWPGHGIRILPGPSSLWLDARGRRFPAPAMPGFDTLATLKAIRATGYDHSWFILTRRSSRRNSPCRAPSRTPI